jgi:beta-lactamase regulating signal transducer with metallopeptidase domain
MSAIEEILREPAAQAIGWSLVHFIWQGALIGILAAVALRLLRTSASDVRYVVAAIALSLMATLPAVTAVQAYRASVRSAPASSAPLVVDQPRDSSTALKVADPAAAVPPSAGTADDDAVVRAIVTPRILTLESVEARLPTLVAIWLAGVVILTLRLLGGWIWVQRIKSHRATTAPRELQSMVARLSRRLHISRRVGLLLSRGVDVPTVIGSLKPVILLPVSALAGLSPAQTEAILAHELAHIRRHDYFVNLLQTLLETVLFYHPAVWWLSRRIRDERENCCDDLAVSLCGDPVTYARALTDLEQHRGSGSALVMAANGGPLVQRIRRLLIGAPAPHAGRGPVWLAGLTALLLMAGVGAAVATTPYVADKGLAETPADTLLQTAPVAPSAPAAPAAQSAASAPSAPPAVSVRSVAPAPSAPSTSPAASAPSAPSAAAAPSAPSAQSAPSSPSASSAPSAPSGPSAQSASSGFSSSSQRSHGTMSWSNNGEKLEVKYDGEFEFTDDDTDMKRMSPGGHLRISDGGWLRGHSVEFTADASGNITRRFWVGASEKPFEPEGRQWLSQKLPRFIRQSGLGAKARAARIFKAQGASGLLAEISRIDGSWAKKRYFTELFALNVDANAVRQALEQAGREIESDYELASLLIESGDRLVTDEATRRAYFDASRTIDSDYELKRVYAAGLKRGPVSAPILNAILDASRNIGSDYELAELLVQLVKQQSIDQARQAFFAALGTIKSNYDHRRVLAALAARPDLDAETTAAMLTSASGLSSDYEAAEFLLQMSKRSIEGPQRTPFFAALETIGGAYERSRVLLVVLRHSDISADTLLAALRAASTLPAGYEMSQVLQTAARHHSISGAARDLYVKSAERLGEYEQSQVLAALVRNESVKR